MTQTEKTQYSTGYYSVNLTSERRPFSKPERRKKDKVIGNPFIPPTDNSFIIPMANNTGTLETSWHLGGMSCPRRENFDLNKLDWDKKVVCPLEQHIPARFSGKVTFHFNDGNILNVEKMTK